MGASSADASAATTAGFHLQQIVSMIISNINISLISIIIIIIMISSSSSIIINIIIIRMLIISSSI